MASDRCAAYKRKNRGGKKKGGKRKMEKYPCSLWIATAPELWVSEKKKGGEKKKVREKKKIPC